MKPLAPDEKLTTVMIYTNDMLVRGDVVVKETIRVSIWLRTQGVPNFIHLIKPQVVVLAGSTPKTLAYEEIFIPTVQVIGFHIAPPAQDPLDYDSSEANRMMQPIQILMGSFILKAKLRISTQTDIATGLDVMHTAWTSVYDAEITNPYLPQFAVSPPMILINPGKVTIALT